MRSTTNILLVRTLITTLILCPLFFVNPGTCSASFTESRSYAYYFFLKGLMELSRGNISEAKKSFLETNYTDPDSSEASAELAIIAAKQNNTEEAIKWGSLALEIDPDNIEAKMLLAQIYNYIGKDKEAIKLLQEILAAEPENESALSMTASIYTRTGEDDKAIDAFTKLLKADGSRTFVTLYYLGKLYQKRGDTEKAEVSFRKAVKDKPDFMPAKVELARCYYKAGRIDKAVKAYKDALKGHANPDIEVEFIELLIKENRIMEAAQELQQMIHEGGEGSIKRALQLAINYIKEEKPDNAILILKIILESHPHHGQTLFLAGLAYEQKEDLQKAEKYFTLIDRNSLFGVEATIRLAWLLEKKGALNSALSMLDTSLKEKPENKELALTFASMLEKKGENKKALETLEKAIELHPSDAEIILHSAMILDTLGKKDKALEKAETALKIDPDYVPALNFVGYIYAEMGIKLDTAEELIAKALSFKPDDGYIVDSMGWVYFMKKEYTLAEKYLAKAHELEPEDPIIISHLGDALIALGKYEKALRVLKKGEKLAGDDIKTRDKIAEQIKTAQKKLWDLVDN